MLLQVFRAECFTEASGYGLVSGPCCDFKFRSYGLSGGSFWKDESLLGLGGLGR